MPELPEFHVLVKFGSGIDGDAQGMAMLGLEKLLRCYTGLDIEVFKDTMADDSKLRRMMTAEERAKL